MRFNEKKYEDFIFYTTYKTSLNEEYAKLIPYVDRNNAKKILYSHLDEAEKTGGHKTKYVVREGAAKNLETFRERKRWADKVLSSDKMEGLIGISSTNECYVCCPECKHFSKYVDFFLSEDDWDNLLIKYADTIIAKKLFVAIDNYYDDVNSLVPKEDLIVGMSKELYLQNKKDESPLIMWYGEALEDFKKTANGNLIMKCPHCGEELEISPLKVHKVLPEGRFKQTMFLERYTDSWKDDNKLYINYEIFESGDKIVYSVIKWHLYPNIRGHMAIEKTNSRMTFNTKTGQAYEFRDYDFDKKVPVKSQKEFPKIRNATYNAWARVGTQESAEEVAKSICKKQGIPVISVKELSKVTLGSSEDILSAINRYGKLGKEFIYAFLMASQYLTKKQKADLFNMISDHKVFQKYLEKNGIHGKKITKLCAENPMRIFFNNVLINMGFQNNDVRAGLLENNMDWIAQFLRLTPCDGDAKIMLNRQKTAPDKCWRKFILDYSEVKSEAELAKKIICFRENVLYDTAWSYKEICEHVELNKREKLTLFAGSILDIHDRAYRIANSVYNQPYYIPYTKDELSMNCMCGGYTFQLAKTSEEMMEVGNIMHICVGTYASRAFKKTCQIIFMRAADGKPAACIEVMDDFGEKKLVQIKDYCNKFVKPEKIPAAIGFLKKNGITYDKCEDAIGAGFLEKKAEECFEKLEKTSGYKIFESEESFKKIFLEDESEYILGMIRNKVADAKEMHANAPFMAMEDDFLPPF